MISDRKSWQWLSLCWLAALLYPIGILVDLWLHPDSKFLWPISDNDAMLYVTFIHRMAQGFHNGDAFLWEHRIDPSAILANFHFWPLIFGTIYKYGGDFAYLSTWFVVIALWFYSLFRLCLHLEQPRSYAFFTAGIQVSFIINLAYQVNGLRGKWQQYSFWVTELVRLYPSVISMCIYSSAVLLVALALKNSRWWIIMPASILVSLTCYGRPFDWLVLLGALGILSVIQFFQGYRKQGRIAMKILILACIVSIPFILNQLHYQNTFKTNFLEQMGRGMLQVKLPSHYFQWGIVCVLMIFAMGIAFRKILFKRFFLGTEANNETERSTILWICSIVISGLFAHFKSAFEGGVTIVGFSYFLIFSVVPWSYFLAMHFLWMRGSSSKWKNIFQSNLWVIGFFTLLITQQLGLSNGYRKAVPKLVVGSERLRIYDRIRSDSLPQPVILTLGRGIEALVFTDAWLFFPNPSTATYFCSAPNTELLERYLFTKLLLTGTLEDIAPLFSEKGIPDLDKWLSEQNPKTKFWYFLLHETIGSNTYIFHPQKNQGELKLRKIVLPEALAKQKDVFVAYFTHELRNIFNTYQYSEHTRDPFGLLSQPFRLDYVYVPNETLPFIDLRLLEGNQRFQEVVFQIPVDGKLWKIKRNL